MPGQADADYLRIFDALPDLIVLAKEQTPLFGNAYYTQIALREEYRRKRWPFKWSRPLRHLYHCPLCEQTAPEILYELENPTPRNPHYQVRQIKVLESELHQVRVHNSQLKEEYSAFLANITLPPA